MTAATQKKRRPTPTVDQERTRQGFAADMQTWRSFPIPIKAAFNQLCVKMQQVGLLPIGARQTGCTLFMQMNRAVRSVYGGRTWTDIPAVPVSPPAPPQFTLTATQIGTQTTLQLNAPAYASGCQVWCTVPFVPGIRDPFAQRMKQIGALPQGWPDSGADLSAFLAAYFRAPLGAGLVVKIVPVSPEGFLGSPLAEMCIVGDSTLSLTTH